MSGIREIPVAKLRLGMYLHDLGASWLKHPFLRSSFLLTQQADIEKIQNIGIQTLWIDESKGEPLELQPAPTPEPQPQPAEEAQASTAAPEKKQEALKPVPLAVEIEHARRICQAAKEEVKQMFSDLRMGKTITEQSVMPLVEEIASSISRNNAAIISVARLKTHDDYTYLHSVAVCGLMVALGQKLGLDDAQVRKAGVGGLMHDFGKAFMPLDVLNKPGKLTDAEFAIMKSHPVEGAKALEQTGSSAETVDIALHHHEKMNGLGYPYGLKDDAITLLARMGAVCDVYDAVTSVRPYKDPWDPAMALQQMAQWKGHFDPAVFNGFVKSLGIYPIGSLVKLASNRLAVVTAPGENSMLKPIVRVFYSLSRQQEIAVETVDLGAKSCLDSITARIDPEPWGFKNLEKYWIRDWS